jgi:hypothetical protein
MRSAPGLLASIPSVEALMLALDVAALGPLAVPRNEDGEVEDFEE